MKDFRQLKVWEKAHHLALEVYKATATFPKEELYGLTSQIRRALHQFLQILLKEAVGTLKLNSHASFT